MRVLVLIPARGGSKGLPGKNLREVGGISLVGRAVRVGRHFLKRSGVDGIVLVDTDDEAIAAEGRRWGAAVPFLRPSMLAGDTTPMIENVLAAAERVATCDVVVLLQPTSPLRDAADVAACWARFDPSRAPSIVAVTPADHPPEQTLRLDADGVASWAWPQAAPEARRQDQPAGFRPSGSVYIDTLDLLRREGRFFVPGVTRGVILPAARSIDVDDAGDLARADALARAGVPRPVAIDGRAVGDGRCYVIAEAGVNANGDVDLAHRLIDVAADADADAVKFQTFDPERLVAPDAPMADYQVANTGRAGTQAEMLRKLMLPLDAYPGLQEHARRRGLAFLSTPFDEASADFLEQLGLPAFKIASGELTNHPLLRHVARKGRPMLLSTGMADMVEVGAALDALEGTGVPVALFHCVTNYPASPADANLRAMGTMRAAFGVPTGWSDHTEGIQVTLAAVASGAEIVEKHFTLDRSLPGPDHRASLDPRELRALVQGIRAVESSLGDGVKRPRPSELPLVAAARKSLHAARDLSVGHRLVAEDLIALRPGTGIAPARLDDLLGRPIRVALRSGERLAEEHLG